MTAYHLPGGPLWQPSSRSGIQDDEDQQPIPWGPDMPAAVVHEPAPALSLAEWVDKAFPGFWERGAGGVS